MADQPAYSPSCSIEVLAGRADGQSQGCDFGIEGSNAREGNVVQAVVNLVREDQDFMTDTERGDFLKFGSGEYFADRIMTKVNSANCYLNGRRVWRYGVLMTCEEFSCQ